MYIAVDAMGGDYAPRTVVEGAVLAARGYNLSIYLVGQVQAIEAELKKHNLQGLTLEIVPATEVVEMDDQPTSVLRSKKRDSSLRRAAQLVKEGRAAAMVSAGNTGAAMACAKVVFGAIAGVERPAIAVLLPSLKGLSLLLDAGANTDCKPFHLLQFAIMGSIYAKEILGVKEPNVGLLNIGEEKGKGDELARQAYELLEKADIKFVGNVEGKHIYDGEADVIVCDGFVGNITLKVSEAVANTIIHLFSEQIKLNWRNKLAYALLRPSLRKIKLRIDYSEYGGAPLLGVNEPCIICHGSSDAKAIKNAIRVAGEVVEHKVNTQIAESIVHRSRMSQMIDKFA